LKLINRVQNQNSVKVYKCENPLHFTKSFYLKKDKKKKVLEDFANQVKISKE
jgi:hypothetical protein